MNTIISEREILLALRKAWPMFDAVSSYEQMINEGWVNNYFFAKDIPYVWRDNRRIREKRFWEVFVGAFDKAMGRDEYVLFHEKHAGWKRKGRDNRRNGIILANAHDVAEFMSENAFYARSQWQYGKVNDNYNLICIHNKSFASFTHEGEFVCFSESGQILDAVSHHFHVCHCSCKLICGEHPGSKEA